MVLVIGLFVLIYGFVTRNQNRKNAEMEKEKRQQEPRLLNKKILKFGDNEIFKSESFSITVKGISKSLYIKR